MACYYQLGGEVGLFANFGRAARQAKAAAILQRLLEAQLRTALGVSAPPAVLASKLVQVVCDQNPGLLASRPMPNEFSLGAAALASGANAMQKSGDRETELALASCLTSLMVEVSARGAQLKLNPIDLKLLAAAEDVVARVAR
jgi:hypothetical protein